MTPREPEVVRPDRPPRRPDPLIMRYPSDLREPLNWVIFPGLAVWLGLGLGLAALARTAFGAGLAPPSGRARRLWRVASDRRLVMLLVGAGAYVWIAVEVSAIAFRYLYPIYGAVAVAAGGGFAAWTVRRSGAEGARPHRWHWWLLGAAAAGQFLGVLAYFSFVRERRVGPQGRQAVAEIAARAQPGQAVFSPDARIVRWYGRMPAFWSQTWSVGIERSLGRLLDLDRPERVARLLADADVGFLFTSRQRLQHAEGAFHDGFSVPWLDRLEQAGVIRRIVDNPGWLAWEVVPPGPTTRPEDRPAPDDEDAADGE